MRAAREPGTPHAYGPRPRNRYRLRQRRSPASTLRPRHALCDGLGNANGHHRSRHRSRHGLRGGVAIATSTLRSCCTPSARASPRNQVARQAVTLVALRPAALAAMCPGRQAGPHKERRSGQRDDRLQAFDERRAHRPPYSFTVPRQRACGRLTASKRSSQALP